MIKAYLSSVLALFCLSLLPIVEIPHWLILLFAALVLTVFFGLVRPILHIICLPFHVVTFGFTSTLLTIGLFWLATYIVPGLTILPAKILGRSITYPGTLFLVSVLFVSLRQFIRRILGY